MKLKTVYSVEEVEGKDGSVSTEWKTPGAAERHAKKVLAKPGYGVTSVRVWRSELLYEDKVK
jgi:hypothetical protein